MLDSYRSQADMDADKACLVLLHQALHAAQTTLRLDGCRLWTIRGRGGNYVSTWGDAPRVGAPGTWMAFVQFEGRARAWTAAKNALTADGLCQVTQDGDDEGVVRIMRQPTAQEAETIRRYVGVRQTRDKMPKGKRFEIQTR